MLILMVMWMLLRSEAWADLCGTEGAFVGMGAELFHAGALLLLDDPWLLGLAVAYLSVRMLHGGRA